MKITSLIVLAFTQLVLPIIAYSASNIQVEIEETNYLKNKAFNVRYILNTSTDSLDTPLGNDFLITDLIYAKKKILSTKDTVSEVKCLIVPFKSGEAQMPTLTFFKDGKKIKSSNKSLQIKDSSLSVTDSLNYYEQMRYDDDLVFYSLMNAKKPVSPGNYLVNAEFTKKEVNIGDEFNLSFSTNDLDAIFDPPDLRNFELVASPVEVRYSKVSKPFKVISYKLRAITDVIDNLKLTAYFSNGVVMESQDVIVIVVR
jgi:hypothetical protein